MNDKAPAPLSLTPFSPSSPLSTPSALSALPPLSPEQRGMLLDSARCARQKALAPRSHFSVGAALLSGSGQVFCGCNVELLRGYGICAEGVAIGDALTRGEHVREGWGFLRAMAVSTEITVDAACAQSIADASPCGICRQVMHDFCDAPHAEIILDDGACGLSMSLATLLPFGYRFRAYENNDPSPPADCEALEEEAVADPSPENLLRIARAISRNAAAHTRGQPEGAVILTRDGRAFCGVSVENSNASHYIRALQVAINRAVLNGVVVACAGEMDVVAAVALYAPHQRSAQTATDPLLVEQFFAKNVRVSGECADGVISNL